MTHQQFLSLKVWDRVYVPNRMSPAAGTPNGSLAALSTEVLSIDRLFGKIKVLLGRPQGYSYRYVRLAPGKLRFG